MYLWDCTGLNGKIGKIGYLQNFIYTTYHADSLGVTNKFFKIRSKSMLSLTNVYFLILLCWRTYMCTNGAKLNLLLCNLDWYFISFESVTINWQLSTSQGKRESNLFLYEDHMKHCQLFEAHDQVYTIYKKI